MKKDDSGRRWVELEYLVPGTPEQVWHAIATGPGMTAWFTPVEVDERVGGAISFDFGDGTTTSGEVTAWDPPTRFAYEERDWNGDAPPVATEVTVTSRSGDRCVVRMVHSLFTSRDDWDDELESFESGWPGFFEVLRVYLGRFAGQPAASVFFNSVVPGAELDVWSQLTSALNLTGVNVGERREAPTGSPRIAGVVHRIHQDGNSRDIMLRLDQPCNGVAWLGTCVHAGQVRASVNLYFYGADAAGIADTERDKWTGWLRGLLGAEQVAT